MLKSKHILPLFVACAGMPSLAFADEHEHLDEELSSRQQLDRLAQQIASEPYSLNTQFEYAKAAEKLNQYSKAEASYLDMLSKHPNLFRVKLDLALLYTRTGRFASSQTLLEEVLDSNPPDDVQTKIREVMAYNEEQMEPHTVSGTVTVGANYDTNANSASSSGNITFLEQNIPLENRSTSQEDWQLFGSLSVNHQYRYNPDDDDNPIWWRSSISTYNTRQVDVSDLDLNMVTLRTGPSLFARAMDTSFDLAFSYSYVELDSHEYLDLKSVEGTARHNWNDNWQFSLGVVLEDRDFENSPSVSTYEDRTGDAVQLNAGARYIITMEDILSITGLLRQEETRRRYYNYDSWGLAVSYTHLFPDDWFSIASISRQERDYDEADPLISATIRDDNETSVGLTLGKELDWGLTGTAGYSYRQVDSNIQNYEYDNHRWSFALSKRF